MVVSQSGSVTHRRTAEPACPVPARRHLRRQSSEGANPADMPVEQSTELKLVITLKTGR